MRFLLAAALICCSALLGTAPAAAAGPRAADLVQVELLAAPRAIRPGESFDVGVRLTMREGWHTYWRNPGDSGLATEIKWTLPPGFTAGPIQWPIPERIPVAHLVNYGFAGATTLLTRITAPADWPAGRAFPVQAEVNYLVCQRECIPGEAKVETGVDVAAAGESAGADPLNRHVFEEARSRLPVLAPWPSRLSADADGRLSLRMEAAGLQPDRVRSATFFPADETALEHAAAQPFALDDTGFTLGLSRSALANGPVPAEIPGVLVIEEALDGAAVRHGFEIGTAVAAPGSVTHANAPELSLAAVLGAAAFAFLGGLILNLMPCVFPVLSIKVLSLVRHSGRSPGAIRVSALAYTAGVVACFVALAALLLAVRAAGAEVGWGYQLQNPATVAAIAFLLFAMGLSLSGAVSLGTSLAGLGGRFAERSGVLGSFGTGALAAFVATPCTAPFMGAAVGYALAAPAPVALGVFVALGLGMAAPFLLLTFRPSLLSVLPKPGAWMERLKQVLAFPLYATVAWLVFVLAQQVGPESLFAILLGFVLLGFGFWALGAAGTGRGRVMGRAAAAAAAVGVAVIAGSAERAPVAETTRLAGAAGIAGAPEPFTQARLDALRAEGRPVLVNMTAAWCITCLVNERAALSGDTFRQALARGDVAYLKGDWTNRNPEITRLLERHGRSGVPLYVLYPARGEPVVLPQLLTEAAVLDELGRLASPGPKRASLDDASKRR